MEEAKSNETQREAEQREQLRQHGAHMTQHLQAPIRVGGTARAEPPAPSAKVARAELDTARRGVTTARALVVTKRDAIAKLETALADAQHERSELQSELSDIADEDELDIEERVEARLRGETAPERPVDERRNGDAVAESTMARAAAVDGEISVLERRLSEARAALSAAESAEKRAVAQRYDAARQVAFAELAELVEGKLRTLALRAWAFAAHDRENPHSKTFTVRAGTDNGYRGNVWVDMPFDLTNAAEWERLRRELLGTDETL